MPSPTIASVVDQTHDLASWVVDADPTAPVPTCPKWVLRDLAEHVGATQRWVARLVTDQIAAWDEAFAVGWETIPDDQREWSDWLSGSAAAVAAAFADPPAGASVFDPSMGGDGVTFWSTRLLGEISVHRIDAAETTGQGYELAADTAGAAVDDWLTTMASAGWAANVPGFADAMRGSGQRLAWIADDLDQAWLLRRTEAPLELKRTSAGEARAAEADVAITGDAVDLLRVVSRRQPLDRASGVVVTGERDELTHLIAHMDWVGA